MITVYISIGNSDDKLTQRQWSEFYRIVSLSIRDYVTVVHGQWVSEPASSWQNACWCVEVTAKLAEGLKVRLAEIAGFFSQESIAWAEVAVTEFITP